MLGYTESELDQYFGEHAARHAAMMGVDMPAYRAELRRIFNGYRFWKTKGESVYNPVSINLNLGRPEASFQLCWTKTGRPSMLMNFLERGDLISLDPECVKGVDETDFDVTDLAHLKAVPMLYQTGYLAVRDYNPVSMTYTLAVPDEEVRQDLSLLMTSQIACQDVGWAASLGAKLLGGDWDSFFVGLKSLYGATTQAERKHYATPYLAVGKPVWVIGLSFDSKSHELVDHCVEEWKAPRNVQAGARPCRRPLARGQSSAR